MLTYILDAGEKRGMVETLLLVRRCAPQLASRVFKTANLNSVIHPRNLT